MYSDIESQDTSRAALLSTSSQSSAASNTSNSHTPRKSPKSQATPQNIRPQFLIELTLPLLSPYLA